VSYSTTYIIIIIINKNKHQICVINSSNTIMSLSDYQEKDKNLTMITLLIVVALV